MSEGRKLMKSKRGKKGALADDPDDLDPHGDTGAGDAPPAADDDEPGDDDGRARS